MVRQFLQINQQRIKFLILVFSGVPSILLFFALLVARTEVHRPFWKILTAVLIFAVGTFLITSLVLFVSGVSYFSKHRQILTQPNWDSFFEKFSFQDIIKGNGRFSFRKEAKQGKINNFNTIAFVNLSEKAVHFVFFGKDAKNGKAKYDYQCNCHLQFTNLQMDQNEIETSVMNFINEVQTTGITSSEWTTHNMSNATSER